MQLQAHVTMPFGRHPGPDGQPIDFDRIYADCIRPGLEAAGLQVIRPAREAAAGTLRGDLLQHLLIADLVLADLTIDDPDVWYHLGLRHALRAGGVVLVQGPRQALACDIPADCRLRYHLKDGVPDPGHLDSDIASLAEIARRLLSDGHGRRTSPVHRLLGALQEPGWRQLRADAAQAFWQRHAAWTQWLQQARRSRRPGDLMVLADEMPVLALRADGHFAAGQALLRQGCPGLALEALDACLAAEPGHRQARLARGHVLQRLDRLDDARDQGRQLLAAWPQDAAAWDLLGCIDTAAWTARWHQPGATPAQRARDAVQAGALLAAAIDHHLAGFRSDANHHRAGIHAATLIGLRQHLTGCDDPADALALLLGGVRWAAQGEQDRQPGPGAAATLADLAVLTGTPQQAAAACAAWAAQGQDEGWALDDLRRRLHRLRLLGFRPEVVDAAIATTDDALARLWPPGRDWRPRQVVLFTGHIVDAPDRPRPRFPAAKVPSAARRIAGELARLGAGPDDLAITQGAAGGDLLFAEAAQALGMRLQLLQPFDPPAFLQASVAPSGPEWLQRHGAVVARLDPRWPVRSAPQALGPAPEGVNPYARCNRWLLSTALAAGSGQVRLVALWDGRAGDGPGGTAHLVGEVRRRGGLAVVIDTHGL